MAQLAAFASIQQDLERVEEAILSIAPSDYPELADLIRGLVSAGGKRIRPALVLLAGSFCPARREDLVNAGAATELLHTATLVHDDTIDESPIRRGRATLNSMLPPGPTILVGDYIFAQSAIFAARPGNTRAVGVFAKTLAVICDGELRQLIGHHQTRLSRDEYFQRIYAKTGALLACATEIGGILSDAPEPWIDALRLYGARVGEAYQVVDDILDFTATSSVTGKPVAADLHQGIATLPTILYLERAASANGRAGVVLDAIRGREDADYDLAMEIIRESGAVDAAYREAERLRDEACAALLSLPACDARSALTDLAGYVVRRDR